MAKITKHLQTKTKESRRQKAMERQLKWMDEGFAMGKNLAKKREDIYDRI